MTADRMTGAEKRLQAILMAFAFAYLVFPAQMAGQQKKPKLFNISNLSGALVLQYQSTSEEETSFGNLWRDLDRKYLEGGAQLNSTGSIYHPNFLAFQMDLNVLAHRTRSTLFDDSAINNAINNTYNILLHFFQKKNLSLQLFARRNFTTSDQAFYERFFITHKIFGAKLMHKGKRFPFRLEAYTTDIVSDSLSFRQREENTKNLDLDVSFVEKEKTRSMATLKWKDYEERQYDIRYKSLDAMANFLRYYGSHNPNQFSSTLTFHKMTGDTDLETLTLRNALTHYFTPRLRLHGNYNLTADNSYQRSYTKHEPIVSLNHRLYESLDSDLRVGGRFENSKFQKVDTLRYEVNFNYRKKIPTGLIQVSYINRRESGKYSSKTDIITTSETHDFSYADSLVLTRQGINPDSVRVTDENLTFIYVRDVDYQLDTLNNTLTITRLPGGAIPPGGVILVHFDYLAYPDYDLKIRYYYFSARLNVLKHFSLYYRRSDNNQDITSQFLIPPFESFDREVVGSQVTASFLRADVNRVRYNSTLSSYISKNYRLSANVKPFKFLSLSGSMAINRLEYLNEDLFSHLDAYSAECTLAPLKNMSANAVYRRVKYTNPTFLRDRKSVIVKFHWKLRKVLIDVFYEHIFTGFDIGDRLHDYFSLQIRRLF